MLTCNRHQRKPCAGETWIGENDMSYFFRREIKIMAVVDSWIMFRCKWQSPDIKIMKAFLDTFKFKEKAK